MSYPIIADGGPDDLPRTFRREREAREREAAERAQAERAQTDRERLSLGPSASPAGAADDVYSVPVPHAYPSDLEAAMPAAVKRLDVPFFHLVWFFIKAVFAAIPAMLLLGALLWGGGQLLQTYFPWLVKAQILIHFPN